MSSTPTARNRLNRQGTGDNVGTWGTVLNGQAIDLIDEALDGITSLAVTGNVALSSANYTPDQARRRVLRLTGSPGASYTVTIPSVEKLYYVHNATNATQLVKAGGAGIAIAAGTLKLLYCDGTDCFAPSDVLAAPVGIITDFAGTAPPAGWLFCAGQAVSRSTYGLLFGVLGTAWGAGDGTSTFNVPDYRGVPGRAAPDNMGGSDAGRLAHLGSSRLTIGARIGEAVHALNAEEIPGHAHGGSVTVTHPAHQYATYAAQVGWAGNSPGGNIVNLGGVAQNTAPPGDTTHSFTTGYTGGNQAHNTTPLTNIAPVIIYAGV